MQIEQVLTNDRLRVWNAFWKTLYSNLFFFSYWPEKTCYLSLLFVKNCVEINNKLYSLIMQKFSRYCFHTQMNRLTNLHNYSLYLKRKKEGKNVFLLKFAQLLQHNFRQKKKYLKNWEPTLDFQFDTQNQKIKL